MSAVTMKSGSYTANLLGNIRSHLAGLQGFDVMALELLQNADDARASSVRFDISAEGLRVWNSGEFTYCGDLSARPCKLQASQNYSCDFHRVADVGSGGKLARAENIGRFGIGFVSTYQVTDHPEIESNGIHLTLFPERGQWGLEEVERRSGTTFFLPWAGDVTSEGRIALGVSNISPSHIDQLADDFRAVLRRSLLFLRHVRTAEVWRDGKLLLGCDLDRGKDDELIVSFRPGGEVEQWLVLRSDAAAAATKLRADYPQLDSLQRGTEVTVAIRVEPAPIDDGVLYAFLPTEQLTGLPLHINADFFPESDRKAVIFAGHQHQQAWNEMLIDAAALEVARDPERVASLIGQAPLWNLIRRAYELSRAPGQPACYRLFWDKLRDTASKAKLVQTTDGSLHPAGDVFIPRVELHETQAAALSMLSGRLASEELRAFQVVMGQLGAPILTLERFVNLVQAAAADIEAGATEVKPEEIRDYYRPIWSLTEVMLPDGASHSADVGAQIQRLRLLPILVTEDLYAVTASQSCLVPSGSDSAKWAKLLPRLAVAIKDLVEFPKLARLIPRLDLGSVAGHIKAMMAEEAVSDVLSTDKSALRELYESLADLDRLGGADSTTYDTLRDLPIWPTSAGLVSARRALLPGDFSDPTGHAALLDATLLTEAAKQFLSAKLRVPTQGIRAYVLNVLPAFFEGGQPSDPAKYAALIRELAAHVTLINDDDTREVLSSLPLLPSRDGGWARPADLYRRTDELVRVLGDTQKFWLDPARLPSARSVQMFVDSLGIRRTPLPIHLSWRMMEIAASQSPHEDAVKASAETFYVLCDQYEEWKGRSSYSEAVALLKSAACFPAEGKDAEWFRPNGLYAPFRAEAFKSQAAVLGFRNTGRLVTDLLKDLGVRINPETSLVVAHLQHCMAASEEPHFSTYQVLNERASSDSLIASLSSSACIYVGGSRGFARPDQVYWTPQRLGKYAYTIPSTFEAFRPLFNALGVKGSPEGRDYAQIWLDVVGEHFESGSKLLGAARNVYDTCVAGVAAALKRDEINEGDLHGLQEAPSILNLDEVPTYPDEVLLQDSEWHAGFFNGELNRALCRAAPEHKDLLAALGVKRLTESASVQLEFSQGLKLNEVEFAATLVERADVLARLLHDSPASLRRKARETILTLSAASFEQIRIQASVVLAGEHVAAAPVAASAYFDAATLTLILARPVGDRSWPQALNAIFHQLMPEASGSEVSRLTLSLRPLLGLSLEDAHRELTEAGVPFLDSDAGHQGDDGTLSDDLSTLGSTAGSSDESASPVDPEGEPQRAPIKSNAPLESNSDSATASHPEETGAESTERRKSPDASPHSPPDGREADPSSRNRPRQRSSRPKYKEQWDRRLLSYVRKRPPDSSTEDSSGADRLEHNLAVEAVARAAVCEFERKRGRVPVPMPQTHPGYDIVSHDSITGEERFIEVKGINGEWNQTGVGLSRLQFSNAQDMGESYWLYVVEFVSEPANIRIHPIQSPASQVTSFMFDGNWRDAASGDDVDPAAAFIPGVTVKHQHFGLGEILKMETRGATRVLSVKFETAGTRTVSLNLQTMVIAGQDNADSLPRAH